MTDELSIQAQQPQRTSPMPYVLGGAAVGAAAGGFSPVGVTKPKYSSYEDILKETEDTFDKGIEKGGDNKSFWEAAKEHAEKVRNAEKDYDAKVEDIKKNHTSIASGLPEDNQVAKDLKTAQEKYDAELNKLIESEKSKLGGKGKVTQIPTPDEMRLGIKGDDAAKVGKDWKLYDETLRPDYEKAVKEVKTNTTAVGHTEYASAEGKLNKFKSSIESYYNDVADAVAEKNPKEKVRKQRALDGKLERLIESEYVYSTDDQILEKAFKEGKMQERKGVWSHVKTNYTDPKTGKKYVLKDGVKLKDLKAADRANIDSIRNTLAEEIQASNSAYSTAKNELKRFEARTEFKATSKKGGVNTRYVCDLADINGKNAVQTYKDELKIIEQLADPKKAKKVDPAKVKALQTKYGLDPAKITEHSKLETAIKNRLSLATEFAEKSKAVTEAIGGQSRIATYKAEMEKAISSNNDVKNLTNRIKGLAKKYGINLETSVDSDIATKAEEAAKKKIEGLKVSTDLQHFKEQAVKEAEKLGVKGEGLTAKGQKLLEELGTKENYTQKLKDAAKEALEKDMGKIKTPNRWINGAIAALALAGVGYLIAPKNNQA